MDMSDLIFGDSPQKASRIGGALGGIVLLIALLVIRMPEPEDPQYRGYIGEFMVLSLVFLSIPSLFMGYFSGHLSYVFIEIYRKEWRKSLFFLSGFISGFILTGIAAAFLLFILYLSTVLP